MGVKDVLAVDDYGAIRRARRDGLSIRQIALRFGHSRETVRHVLRHAGPPPARRTRERNAPVIGPFEPIIDRVLADDEAAPPKPRHTAAQIFRCLHDEHGYRGGYAQVRRYVHKHRRRHEDTFIPLGHLPGQFAEGHEGQRSTPKLCDPDHEWMLGVLQGKEPLDSIRRVAANNKGFDKLVMNLRYGNLTCRNKSLAIIAKLRGISFRSISKFLHIHRKTASGYWNTYKIFGHERLFEGFHNKVLKSDDEKLINLLFSVLHAPPSAFGFNRTTWKREDLKRVLGEQGCKVSFHVIRRIVRDAGYQWKHARKVLTSNDPKYQEKLERIQSILSALGPNERFFSIDEYGPFAVKMQGGRSLVPPGMVRTVPQRQRSKGSLILTAALELSTNQVTHFYSEKKNTAEMIKLLDVLLVQYADCDKIYFSWDAASWHASKALNRRVDVINSPEYKAQHRCPFVELVPLPSCAQFLNVIESVFSGMAKAIIHNSDYESLAACKAAIDRYFVERNDFFKANPKRAGRKIWGKESVPSQFSPSNNCKNPKYHFYGF
jgi:transposase